MNEEFEQRYGYIVVKNKQGHGKQVKIFDYNEFQQNPIEGHFLCGYKYDLEWDLSHGFIEANKAFEEIENGYQEPKEY